MPDPLTLTVIGALFVSHMICAALGFSIGATVGLRQRGGGQHKGSNNNVQ